MISRVILLGLPAADAGVAERAISDTRGSTMLFSVTATDAVDAVVDEVELFLLCPKAADAAPVLEEDDRDAMAAAASVSCWRHLLLLFLLLAILSGDMKAFLLFLAAFPTGPSSASSS